MKIETFDDDLLDLQPFAARLLKFIEVEHQFVDGSLVVALNSKFGSGKTTFLQMWIADLESREDDGSAPLVIYLNAWESDYYGDPLFAIISGLADRIRKYGKSAESIIDAAKTVGWFATAIGGQIVQKLTGIDAVAAGDIAEKKKSIRDRAVEAPEDTFSVYVGRKAAMANLRKAVDQFVASSIPKVLFLVDELDRCRPDYAIAYLETIKHIFDVQGAVFILAADRQHLANSAKTAFGPDLDFEEYYRKFVHREVTLPPLNKSEYQKLSTSYVNHYLQRDGLRACFMELESHRVENICELVAALRLTPRQIQEVFRILGHVLATSGDKQGRLRWCLAVGNIVMAALRAGNPRVYHSLGEQGLEPKEALSFLNELLGEDRGDWWFLLLLTGGGLKVNEGESLEEVMIKVGLAEKGTESRFISRLGQWREGWGHTSTNRFADIHQRIEHIMQWT